MNNILIKTTWLIMMVLSMSNMIRSQQQDEFLIGTFIHSSENMEHTQYNNYEQIQELGVNAVFQVAVKPVRQQSSNLGLLSGFKYVYAANDSGYRQSSEDLGAKAPENTDWISYFTQAKYRKWEAEGDPLFNGQTKIKHEFGQTFTYADTNGWSSGNNSGNIGKLLVTGPDYWQYPRYTWTNVGYNPTVIEYKAVFRMRIDSPSPEITLPICQIYVTQSIYDTVTQTWQIRDTLNKPGNPKVKTLTTSDLSTEFNDIFVEYNYEPYITHNSPEEMTLPAPGGILANQGQRLGYNIYSKVQFNIRWLGYRELLVDRIEVYDGLIWERYFKYLPDSLNDLILTYDQSFKVDTSFYSKFYYYGTQDEPHSIDCYEPLRVVQTVMDAQNIKADLLSHWYPEWNGYWLGNETEDLTWPFYVDLAQPKKIMFWYAPFSVTDGVNNSNDLTLFHLQKNLQWAHELKPNFYMTLQSWGTKVNGVYPKYRVPTPEEIGAETMLSLAHGVKGIFYEMYYSYGDQAEFTEGLVDIAANGYEPTQNWFKVQELSTRLRSAFGNKLMALNYNGNYLQYRLLPLENTPPPITYDYLTIASDPVTNHYYFNWHVGFMQDTTSPSDNRYFVLANLATTSQKSIQVTVTKPLVNFYNYRFKDVESQNNFDISFANQTTQTLTYPAGEGRLYQISPVVKSGGTLAVNDTITSNISLEDNLTISNGVNLVISNSTYTLKDTVTLQGTGFITGSGLIQFNTGSAIVINSFSKGLFKTFSGVHPKLVWGRPTELSSIEKYKIYRKQEGDSWVYVTDVDGESTSYTDVNITILTGNPVPNESYVEYYVIALGYDHEDRESSVNSNTVRYRIDREMQKQASGDENKVTEYELSNNYPM